MLVADDGSCVAAACTPDSCERGVCEPAEGCVDAPDCAGDDTLCLSGSFCGDDSTCQPSRCRPDAPECTRGVCDPDTGQCTDADSCESSRDCQPGSRCLEDECVPEDELCGESGCPEGRVCSYREPTRSAECVEATPCQTSRDCFDGRVCAGDVCVSAPVCEPDNLEPNDDQSEATDFDIVANQDAIDATLCAGDRDTYRLEVTRPEDTSSRRELLVVVEVPRREVGLGQLSASLLDPDGEPVANETSDDQGRIVITHALSLATTGTYHVVVEADFPSDNGSAIDSGGFHYRLVARDMPRDAGTACQRAQPIEPGESVSGNTSVPTTNLLGSRCSADVPDSTDIYALEIDEPSLVDVRLTTNRPQDFMLGLRSDCQRLDTELTCTAGHQSRFGSLVDHIDLAETVLAPGRYFITVHNPDSQGGNAYELEVSASAAACSPAANSCTTPSWSRTCDNSSGDWELERCELGCQPHDGTCRPQMADTCEGAPLLIESGTLPIEWDDLSADYWIPNGSCLPSINRETNTHGPDAVYQVALPAQHALYAKLTTDRPHDVSIYLLDDCLSPGDRCIAGTNAEYVETEELLYWNDSSSSQSLFLVVDAVEGTSGSGVFTASIDPILCEQWESRCHEGELQGCSQDRIAWETLAECQWGCSNSSCNPPPGDTCADAEPLSSGQTFSGVFSDYADTVESVVDHCSLDFPGNPVGQAGPDAFFSVALTQGDLLTAQIDTSADSTLFVSDSCLPNPDESCLVGQAPAESLEFWAPQTGTYYLGVDTADTGESATFDLTVDIQPGAAVCQPGGTYCDPATGELVICDEQGSRQVDRYQCPNGCSTQGCGAPPSANNTCSTAYSVSGSTRIIDDPNRFSDDFDGSSSCAANNADGPDSVYEIHLGTDDVLLASIKESFNSYPHMYLVTDCTDLDGTCKAESFSTSTSAEIEHKATSPQTVYLIVDRRYQSGDELFMLDIDIRPVECQHGQTQCATNTVGSAGLDYCNEIGLWDPYSCQGGCSAGVCGNPSGGICQDAITVTDGQTVTGDWSGTNNVELGRSDNSQGAPSACQQLGPQNSIGEDTFYRIDLQQDDLLEVSLETVNRYATLHFLTSCTGLDTCEPVTGSSGHYLAETSGPVWVMVDASRESVSGAPSLPYSLSFDVTSGAMCAPSTAACADSTTVEVCNAQGTAVETTYSCPSTCTQGSCQPDLDPTSPNSPDRCTTAPNVGDGILVYAHPDDLTDDVTFGQQSCTSNGQSLPDLVYEVTVEPTEVLRVRSAEARIILMDDCTDPDGTCVDAEQTHPLGTSPNGLFWSPEQTRTINVVADVLYTDRAARLQIDKLPVECTAGARQCSASGDAVQSCESWGLWRSMDCQTTCSNGRCDLPTGEYCQDAIQLSAGMSVEGSFDDFNDDVSIFDANCPSVNGSDAVYEIELTQGDVLDTILLGSSGSTVSIAEGCSQSGFGACLSSSMGERELSFVAPSSGTYFIMVGEGSSWMAGDDFLLEVDVRSGGVCTPGASYCDQSTGVAEVCNQSGTGFGQGYQCAGGCDGAVCAAPSTANDTCATAQAINSGTVIVDNFNRFNDDYLDPANCGTSSLAGKESVFEVSLDQGDVLRAELQAQASGSLALSPHLIVTDQCGGSGTCLATSADQGPIERRSAEVTYHANTSQPVYLIVDAESYNTMAYRLEIDIGPAECTPGSAGITQCVDANTLQTCPNGHIEQRDCEFGCNNGACNTPTNDVCSGATPIPRDGDFHTKDVHLADDYTNTVNVGATINSCANYGTIGPDAIYRLDAQAGDVVTAYWQHQLDVYGWLTSDCSDASQSCIVASREGNLEQTIETTGTYWFVLDSGPSAEDEMITLDVRLAPTICQPGQSTCDTSTGVISYCNATGTAFEDYVCQGGCSTTSGQPRCGEPRGEQCVDAIDASSGGVFALDVGRFDNTFTHSTNTCIASSSDGGDVIYRVDLAAGETVEAVTAVSQNDAGGLYILDDCHTANPDNACLTGDFAWSGQTASVSHTATVAETVYVVVDSRDSSDSYTRSVDISVY
jgi:hypothetical protein